ncbi:MAG: asparaginase [Halorubrum sp.]
MTSAPDRDHEPTEPHVCVLACGGTIASEPDADGAAPAKTGDDLVAAVPGVEAHATVSTREICSQPGFDVRWRDVFATAAAAIAEVNGGADGVVVTHGTDTLVDTAYALDLLTDLPVPVVVTGAQRRLDEPSSDAPANLTLAVRAAADERFSAGVHVAFDDELHAARDAIKAHSNALSTIRSPASGPVATFTRHGSRVLREPSRGVATDPLAEPVGLIAAADSAGSAADGSPASLDLATAASRVPDVPVVHSGTGAGAGPIERSSNAGVGGLVIEGTGLGNVTAAIGDAIREAVASVPIVVAGRPPAGPTEPVYGTSGGAVTLAEHGVVFAADLSAAKARVGLAIGLAAGLDEGQLVRLFEQGPPRRS